MQAVYGVHYDVYSGARRRYSPLGLAIRIATIGLFLAAGTVLVGSHEFSVSLQLPHKQTSDAVRVALSQPTVSAIAPATQQPAPAPVPAADTAGAVTQAVQAAMAQNKAEVWGVAIYDLTGKQWLTQLNADQQMDSASLYKLYATYALAQTVPVAQWDNQQIAGHSVRACVDLMLRVSDNNCGEAVGGIVGWTKITKLAQQAGYSQSVFNKTTGPVTTAADTSRYMADLYSGKLFDAATTGFILNSLAHQKYRSGIPAGCIGCTTYNKTGSNAGIAHDAAIVQSGSTSYAITVMSKGGSAKGIAAIEAAVQTALQR